MLAGKYDNRKNPLLPPTAFLGKHNIYAHKSTAQNTSRKIEAIDVKTINSPNETQSKLYVCYMFM